MGIGFAAIRDLVSFLRYEADGNPLADGICHALLDSAFLRAGACCVT